MLDTALKFIKIIEDNGFEAYIVGGFVRDYLLGIESNDIDVCTNARPSDIREIFKDNCLPNDDYGSVTVLNRNTRFEITTFRKEMSYINNRKPGEYIYIDSLEEDLKRRDFTINTICIDSNNNIIDILGGREDLKKMEINTVGNSIDKFTEDALRILRAVRFATVLDFKLSDEVKEAIIKTRGLLSNLSYERKKEELDKIFASIHVNYGIKLLIELGLDKELEINKLKDIKYTEDLIAIWAMLNVDNIYPFSKNEKDMMDDIREALELDNLDTKVLYKYGPYVNGIAAAIKGLDKKVVSYKYDSLPIKEKSEIKISSEEIMNILEIEPGNILGDIIDDIEEKILFGTINNNIEEIKEYLLKTWKK